MGDMTESEKLVIAIQALRDIWNPIRKLTKARLRGSDLSRTTTALLCDLLSRLKEEEGARNTEGKPLHHTTTKKPESPLKTTQAFSQRSQKRGLEREVQQYERIKKF
jgi:hypothetical protein